MQAQENEKRPLSWWLRLLIAIGSAIIGMITENATDFIGSF